MSAAIPILITRDQATPALLALLDRLQPANVAKEVGEACLVLTQKHLLANGRNKRGWPSTNFWSRAAKATSWAVVGNGALISINQIGVRQRYYGGPIRPVNKKALTIPIASQAYGKTVKDFPGAFLLKTKKGWYIVRYGGAVSKTGRGVNFGSRKTTLGGKRQKAKSATLEFLFKLSFGVNQQEDRTIIPDAVTYRKTTFSQIDRIIARHTRK